MLQPSPIRRVALRLLLGGAVLALAGCGRKGSPLPPTDVDPCYPRHYPMDQATKEACAQKEIYAREHPPQPQQKKGQRQPSSAPAQPQPAAPASPTAPAETSPPGTNAPGTSPPDTSPSQPR